MSTVVYQNTHSFFDTQLVQPMSLSLKLNPPYPHLSQCLDLSQKSSVSDSTSTGWACIQALSNASDLLKETADNKAEVYVHPLVRRSASMLSEKSLEMCTENLGSETGTDIIDDDIFSTPSLDSDAEESTIARNRTRSRQKLEARKAGYESIPPPLTTICGANSIRVEHHRENGRLVMRAVSASPRRSRIRTERSNGRLTMSLLEDFTQETDSIEEEIATHDEEENECDECEEDVGVEKEKEGAEGEEEGQEEAELIGVCLEEDYDGIKKEVMGKIGIGEFQRPSRCNEGGRGTRSLIPWKPLCLAS